MKKALKMSRSRKNIDTSTYEGRFAERLRSLREKAKMTVSEFSAASGIACTTLHNWEAGIRNPPFNALPVLAKTLGVKIRTLMPEE